ncbi:MAG: S8 family serine peptidase, partial [Acidobacteriia bacterium]|nr:S8 family serine peptidase [Terriglobia bacterium]
MGLAFAQATKKSPDFSGFGAGTPVQVLVQFDSPLDNSLLAALTGKGAAPVKTFKHIKAGVFQLPAGIADSVTGLPGIKYLSIDRPVQSHLDISVPTVGADLAHRYGWTGQGIGVAVIDSGISPHTDLNVASGAQSRVVYSQSFVAGEPSAADRYGHGTHVAGIIAGNGAMSKGTSRNLGGIAPQVDIVNLRALDENGAGTDSSVIAAIDEAIELKNQYNIRVINLSLGRSI